MIWTTTELFVQVEVSYHQKGWMRTSDQEALWVLRAQFDDQEALELLLRGVQPSLRGFLTGLVGPSDADDVLQDVLVLIYRKLRWLQSPELFRPWAFRIASRAGFRHAKRRRRWAAHVDDETSLDDVAATDMRVDPGRLPELLTANQISPGSSAVLILHFQEEMSLAEVAAVLEVPLGTVKSRLAYGLAALRKRLGNRRNL
jgi:RNA polymerase sigma-70 factor (ECF subfamily)